MKKLVNLVNLTQHSITILSPSGERITIAPSGQVARVATQEREVPVEGLPCPAVTRQFGQVEGLPEPQPGVVFIVSALVLSAVESQCPGRRDVAAPDTGPTAVRTPDGRIEAVRRLVFPAGV